MQDCYDAPLTFSRGPYDTMMLALLRCVYTGRNDSQVLMSMEQALPVHHSWLNFNRYCYSQHQQVLVLIPSMGVRAHSFDIYKDSNILHSSATADALSVLEQCKLGACCLREASA